MFIDMEHLREKPLRKSASFLRYRRMLSRNARSCGESVLPSPCRRRKIEPGLTLGQHPNRGKRVELNAGGSNEFIGGFEVFRFMHGVVVSDFNSYPIRS